VKRHPASDGLLTCGDPIEFADASVDPGSGIWWRCSGLDR
jgi:hypothetical protein